MPSATKFAPDGHFYSAIPDIADLKARSAEIWPEKLRSPSPHLGVDYRIAEQLQWMDRISPFAAEADFPDVADPHGTRYFYRNDSYPALDADVLYGTLRLLEPRRIIEVGSGYSSL
ncbi:MAG: hypothetical protein AAGA56_17300, partial [Myxococcota bacterium]